MNESAARHNKWIELPVIPRTNNVNDNKSQTGWKYSEKKLFEVHAWRSGKIKEKDF